MYHLSLEEGEPTDNKGINGLSTSLEHSSWLCFMWLESHSPRQRGVCWCPVPNRHIHKHPGPWFNIKTLSYEYWKSHCGDKTVVRSSYLHNGIFPILVRRYLYIESGPRWILHINFDIRFIIGPVKIWVVSLPKMANVYSVNARMVPSRERYSIWLYLK